MKGAMAELWARMMSPPSKRSMNTIGSIHQSLAAHRKLRSSLTMENFSKTLFTGPASSRGRDSLLHQMFAEDQHVHPAPTEGAVGLSRGVDDRLALQVEGRVQDHRHPGRLAEELDQTVVTRRSLLVHGLEPRRAVHVRDGGKDVVLAVLHIDDIQHVASGIVARCLGKIEEVPDAIHQDGGGEWAERFPEFDLGVDDVLHGGITGIGEDGPITERAGAPFETALEPADDLSAQHSVHHALHEVVVAVEAGMANSLSLEERIDLAGPVVLTPVGVSHDEAPRLAEHHVVAVEGGTHRSPAVPGSRLDEQLLERRLAENPSVGHAVEGDPARQAQAVESGGLV